jgi:hypothetical protein
MKDILTSMGVGMLLGAGLVYSVMRTQPAHPPGVVASQQWCDTGHTVPFISAYDCGGGSSCERAEFILDPAERARINWPALCRKFQP